MRTFVSSAISTPFPYAFSRLARLPGTRNARNVTSGLLWKRVSSTSFRILTIIASYPLSPRLITDSSPPFARWRPGSFPRLSRAHRR